MLVELLPITLLLLQDTKNGDEGIKTIYKKESYNLKEHPKQHKPIVIIMNMKELIVGTGFSIIYVPRES